MREFTCTETGLGASKHEKSPRQKLMEEIQAFFESSHNRVEQDLDDCNYNTPTFDNVSDTDGSFRGYYPSSLGEWVCLSNLLVT